MIEISGNLFHSPSYHFADGRPVNKFPDAICLTTNGALKNDGSAIMGRGVALEATENYQGIARFLGQLIKKNGNITQVILRGPPVVVSLPTKAAYGIVNKDKSNLVQQMKSKVKTGDHVPGWMLLSTIELIKSSVEQLRRLTDQMQWSMVILPRPGCANGGLSWDYVAREIGPVLDKRFYIITRG